MARSHTVEYEPGAPVFLGRGFDWITGIIRGPAVDGSPHKSVPGIGRGQSQDVIFRLSSATSISELRTSLHIGASASFSSIPGFQAQASVDFIKSMSVNTFSYYMVADIVVTNATDALTELNPTAQADDVVHGGNVSDHFYAQFGDEVIVSITTGGRFIAVVEFQTRSELERQDVKAELSGSGGTWGFDGRTDFASHFSQATKFSSVNIHMTKRGGAGPLPDRDHVVEYALNFPDLVNTTKGGAAELLFFTTSDYSVVSFRGGAPPLGNFEDRDRFLDRFAYDLDRASQILNDIEYVRQNQQFFPSVSVPQLTNMEAAVRTARQTIVDNVVELSAHPFSAELLQYDLDTPSHQLPPREALVPPIVLKPFHQTSSKTAHPRCSLRVDPGYKILGGGARVNCRYDETGGNLLTASYPQDNSTWVVQAKDHEVSDPSDIDVWAIALHDPDDLWDVQIFQETTPPTAHPTVKVDVPEAYLMTGGGAQAHWSGAGSLLTASFPSGNSTWQASSKDHHLPDPCSLTAYAIGIRPKGSFVKGKPKAEMRSATSDLATQPEAKVSAPSGFMMTCGGALDLWNGPGNLLTASYPTFASGGEAIGWTAKGKNHPTVTWVSPGGSGFQVLKPDLGPPARIQVFAIGILR